MSPNVDSAIIKALALDVSCTTMSSHGGGGFASTFKLTSSIDRNDKLFFVKTGKGPDSSIMFTGEHASLSAIHAAVPSLCPKSYAHGLLSDNKGSFLATDFLNLSPGSSHTSTGSGLSLAQKLATLHTAPVPIPDGHDQPIFGFPVTTCCGDTQQDNSYKASWAEFYADNKLRHILRKAEERNGRDAEFSGLVQRTASHVVPRLLREGHLEARGGGNVVPVVIHGDLWSGNHGRGTIGDGGLEEVVFDPSSCWAHREFEFGIMRMFGAFGPDFEKEYFAITGRDEPVGEYEDRVSLYELYHHINHFALFGGSYRNGAVRIMEGLLKKYGNDD